MYIACLVFLCVSWLFFSLYSFVLLLAMYYLWYVYNTYDCRSVVAELYQRKKYNEMKYKNMRDVFSISAFGYAV